MQMRSDVRLIKARQGFDMAKLQATSDVADGVIASHTGEAGPLRLAVRRLDEIHARPLRHARSLNFVVTPR
jgi:hypothetical protein